MYKLIGKWNYICLLIDLFNREIIGYSVGTKKDASLVHQAFMNSNRCLKDIQIFHSDRSNEFNNKIINHLLLAFNINRSLSKKGCPYDNAIAEATFKTSKTEFINDKNFTSLIQLKLELFDYINWYNNIRIYSTLNYLTPPKYQKQMSTKNSPKKSCHSSMKKFVNEQIKAYNWKLATFKTQIFNRLLAKLI